MDKTKVNLERLRACDEWEENKHPRANNGQFTSSSGSAAGSEAASESPLKKAAKIIQGKGELTGYKGLSFTQGTSEADSGTPAGKIHNFIVGYIKGEEPTKENVTAACKQIVNMLNDDISYLRARVATARRYGDDKSAKEWEANIAKQQQKIQAAYEVTMGFGNQERGKSKVKTRLQKDLDTIADDPSEARAILKKRKTEIDKLANELQHTKNSYRAKAIRQDLLRLNNEYTRIDESI